MTDGLGKSYPESMLDYFKYDENTGKVYRSKTGMIVGHIGKDRYERISYKRKTYIASRLCWFLYHKKPIQKYIDYIDGNPLNNRISNLRECTLSENSRNLKIHRNGRIAGLYFVDRLTVNKWCCYRYKNKKSIYLGSYSSKEEAIKVLNNYDLGITINLPIKKSRSTRVEIQKIKKQS